MKKLNPKIITLAFMVLAALTAGGFAVKHAVAPGSTGIGPDPIPNP